MVVVNISYDIVELLLTVAVRERREGWRGREREREREREGEMEIERERERRREREMMIIGSHFSAEDKKFNSFTHIHNLPQDLLFAIISTFTCDG